MKQAEAIELLRQGSVGVAEWNRRRSSGEAVPHFVGADLRGLDLRNINLCGIKLIEAILPGVNLDRAVLRDAILVSCDLRGATIREADLHDVNLSMADLQHADLTNSNLREGNLSLACLNDAKLNKTILTRVDFESARLIRADLRGATLTRSEMRGADLESADLGGSRLRGANLSMADVTQADFANTLFSSTVLGDLDLSVADHLSTVDHSGPSIISLDTILKSKGRIPTEFLRGCGYNPIIQDILTGNITSKTDAFYQWVGEQDTPIKLQSCVISFCHESRAFADKLQHYLNQAGVNYWYAPEHGRWGEEITKQIDREISLRDRVLLICSEDSLNNSDWVEWEIERAVEKERSEGSQVLFPIMIDDSLVRWKHPFAPRLRKVLAGDFRNATEGRAFEEAMKRLIDGLKQRGVE